MIVRAFAKTNLFLHVLARESDGYHQIETLFCLLDLHDTIEIEPGQPDLSLHVDDEATGAPGENLVWRAAEAFFARSGLRPDVRVRLEKRIPVAAGLGGGSSDAAATLLGLNEMHGSPLSGETLLGIAASLGSDVPFFAARTPLALAWGRGERLLCIDSPGPVPALVATPDEPMSTAAAYAAIDARRRTDAVLRPVATTPKQGFASWDEIERIAINDFEPVVIERIPIIADLLEVCRSGGARIAMLCGSGSSCFATFHDPATRDAAVVSLRSRFADVRVLEADCGIDPTVAPS